MASRTNQLNEQLVNGLVFLISATMLNTQFISLKN